MKTNMKTMMKHTARAGMTLLLTAALLLGCLPVLTVTAAVPSMEERTDILPALPHEDPMAYVESGLEIGVVHTLLSSEEAAAAGLPEGYTGTVLKTTSVDGNEGGNGICFDFSDLHIPVSEIGEITFRVLVPAEAREIRLYTQAASWIMRYYPTLEEAGQWVNLSVNNDGLNFESHKDLSSLANEAGELGRFTLLTRWETNKILADFCVDGVTVRLKGEPSANPGDDDPADSGDPADRPGFSEIPYVDHIQGVAPYKYRVMKMYEGADAAAAGVPEGYSGWVMYLSGSAELGFTADFSSFEIPISTVKALHLRVWYPDSIKEVRVTYDAGGHWQLRYVGAKPGQWDDVVLDNPSDLAKLANADGNLGAFGFGFRYLAEGNCYGYVDSISVEQFPADQTPPVIRYAGETTLTVTEGRRFSVDAEAWDEYEQTTFPITYTWSDGALDADGLPVKGTHTCTLSAEDSYGNVATLVLTVNVTSRDTEAPVIGCDPLTIRTFAGVYARLAVPVTDNQDDVTLEIIWPDGAIDKQGRLLTGTHTVILASSDLTGNRTEVALTLIVTDAPAWGEVIEDTRE